MTENDIALPLLSDKDIRQIEKACFIGLLLTAFAYGSEVMILIQTLDVCALRPKRGNVFWGMVIYTVTVILVSTVAAGGRFKFAELMYIDHRNYTGGYLQYYLDYMTEEENVLNHVCLTILPWIADLLLFYRLYVLWNLQWWLFGPAIILYLGRIAISIPMLIITANMDDSGWSSQLRTFKLAYFSISAALNIFFSTVVVVRMHSLRRRVEQAMGKLQATYYTSFPTKIVESCMFFTSWTILHLALFACNHWSSEIFEQPWVYLNVIGRMLLILRMSQNRAWTRDVVTASTAGALDWQVSSTHSIPLHEARSDSSGMDMKKLPKQFREEAAAF